VGSDDELDTGKQHVTPPRRARMTSAKRLLDVMDDRPSATS
jgi:hypothetical protein